MPTPIISDAELVSYDTTNHTFSVTPPARERVSQRCTHSLQVPFVVVAEGEAVYVGVFTTMLSSWSSGIPAILIDHLRMDTAAAYDFRIDRGYPFGGFGLGEDRRGDKRVISAIEKLLRKRERNNRNLLNPAASADAPRRVSLRWRHLGRRATEPAIHGPP